MLERGILRSPAWTAGPYLEQSEEALHCHCPRPDSLGYRQFGSEVTLGFALRRRADLAQRYLGAHIGHTCHRGLGGGADPESDDRNSIGSGWGDGKIICLSQRQDHRTIPTLQGGARSTPAADHRSGKRAG